MTFKVRMDSSVKKYAVLLNSQIDSDTEALEDEHVVDTTADEQVEC